MKDWLGSYAIIIKEYAITTFCYQATNRFIDAILGVVLPIPFFAVFAADFEEVDKMSIEFQLGQPFRPFEQLMGVFPAARCVS